MNFIEFIKTKVFLRHFLVSVILSAVLISIVLGMLKWYTHHGESYKIPSLVGLTPDQIDQLTTIDNFEVLIIDSVFDSRQPRGTVLIQEPVAGTMVKKNRKVYLTTVAVLPERVTMPNLVDLTLRQANATIETYGLRLGNVNYVPDIAANAVLAQFYDGEEIEAGYELQKGSKIDLRVGQEMGNGMYQVPFLIGKTRAEAESLLRKYYFVVGDETFEDDADPETARVYSQTPEASNDQFLNPGQPVNLIYRDPEKFDFDEYLQSLENMNQEDDLVE
jgi:beta-lactam-binding protein with PASTA domain